MFEQFWCSKIHENGNLGLWKMGKIEIFNLSNCPESRFGQFWRSKTNENINFGFSDVEKNEFY